MLTKTKQKMMGSLSAVALLLGLSFGNASALQFTINNGNSGIEPDTDYATVDLSFLSGNTIHVVVTALSGFGIFGNGNGNGAFGFNVVGTLTGVTFANIIPSSGGGACGVGANNGSFDGFGKFEESIECGPAANNITQLSFDLTRPGSVFTSVYDIVEDNAKNNDFAAHICVREAASTECATTGFASTGGSDGNGTGGGQDTAVPEPSSLILLGSGLLVLARAARRKLN